MLRNTTFIYALTTHILSLTCLVLLLELSCVWGGKGGSEGCSLVSFLCTLLKFATALFLSVSCDWWIILGYTPVSQLVKTVPFCSWLHNQFSFPVRMYIVQRKGPGCYGNWSFPSIIFIVITTAKPSSTPPRVTSSPFYILSVNQ